MGIGERRLEALCFVGMSGELRGRQFPLSAGTTIGRAVNASIFLPDPALGRQHCRVDVTSAGFQLINCSRDPGIQVNGAMASRHLLHEGDVVRLGRFSLKVDQFREGSGRKEVTGTIAKPAGRSKPKGEVDSRSRWGTVLTARLHAGTPGKHLLIAVARFRHLFEKMKTPGAELITDDACSLRILWDNTSDARQQGDPTGIELATQAACALHRLAFLQSRPGGELAWSIGIASGEYHWMRWPKQRRLLWGSAVDRSLEFALRAEPSSSLGNPGMVEGESSAAEHRFWGWMPATNGRRRKYSVARLVDLRRPGFDSTALLVQLTHDPETGWLTLGILDGSAFEVGADYTLKTVDGESLAFQARTCIPVHRHRVRAQLVGLHSPESVARIVGFESTAGGVLAECCWSGRRDTMAA